jgi:protein TonB
MIGEYLERKRWMSYASQQQGLTGPKLVAAIIALAIVGAVGAGMVVYLAVDAIKKEIERVTTVEVKEDEPPPPPPDEPPPPEEQRPDTSPPPVNVPAPQLDLSPPAQFQTTPQETPREVIREVPQIREAPPGPPPPKPPSKARGVRTKGERQWAARIQEDYPTRAAREEIEGTVGVRVTVTAEGRATGCSVTASSGSSILDDAACKAVERYARFEPALNDAGEPISASWSTRITYRLN